MVEDTRTDLEVYNIQGTHKYSALSNPRQACRNRDHLHLSLLEPFVKPDLYIFMISLNNVVIRFLLVFIYISWISFPKGPRIL